MNLLYAVILGIVQGLTEFLPVSSSGHLVLLQRVFGIDAPGLFFDTMLHAGTLVAVFAALWKDLIAILKNFFQPLTLYFIIATIPAVIAALFFNDVIENAFETGQFLGFCFLITSSLLFFAEKISKRKGNLKKEDGMKPLDALLIGIMQALAIAPGISRSGATISGSLFRKLDRSFAARFSFILSIPAILGALILQTNDLIKGGTALEAAEALGMTSVIAGTLTAAAAGFFAVKFMLKIIKEKSLYGFALYTGILGVLVILDQFIFRLVF